MQFTLHVIKMMGKSLCMYIIVHIKQNLNLLHVLFFTTGEHMTEYELAEYLTTLLGFNVEGGSSELQEFDSSTAGDIIDQNLPVNVTEEMFANEILGFSMYKDVLAISQPTS